MRFATKWNIGLAVAACGLGSGCGDTGRSVVPVAGRVTLDGRPLPGARVSFQPDGGLEPGRGSIGTTDSDGRYVLTVIGSGGRTGGSVGRNRVMLSKPDKVIEVSTADAEKSDLPVAKEVIPEKYRREGEPLVFEVPEAGTEEANFDLTSK